MMVSVGVSKLGSTEIHFIKPGVKVNGDTIATTFLLINYCQTYSGYPRVGFYFSAGRRIEHTTPSVSWGERCSTSFHQHCGRQIQRILAQSTTCSVCSVGLTAGESLPIQNC